MQKMLKEFKLAQGILKQQLKDKEKREAKEQAIALS